MMERIHNALMIDTRCSRAIRPIGSARLSGWGYLKASALDSVQPKKDRSIGFGSRMHAHALAVLKYMARLDEWHMLCHLSSAIGASKTSTHRAIHALADVGMLRRHRANPRRQYYAITDSGRRFSVQPLEHLAGVLKYGGSR